jgi:hypothetical protein
MECPWLCISKPDLSIGYCANTNLGFPITLPLTVCQQCLPLCSVSSASSSRDKSMSLSSSRSEDQDSITDKDKTSVWESTWTPHPPPMTAGPSSSSSLSSTFTEPTRTRATSSPPEPSPSPPYPIFRLSCPQDPEVAANCPFACVYQPDPFLGSYCTSAREPADECGQCFPICNGTSSISSRRANRYV